LGLAALPTPLPPSFDGYAIEYIDDEGDSVVISSDIELQEAFYVVSELMGAKSLRLRVVVANGTEDGGPCYCEAVVPQFEDRQRGCLAYLACLLFAPREQRGV
jgi:hypothetical protein